MEGNSLERDIEIYNSYWIAERLKEEKRMNEWTTYWWIIEDEDSELCGEEFFTKLKNAGRKEHNDYVCELFPNENPRCLGMVTEKEAEIMGLDTY